MIAPMQSTFSLWISLPHPCAEPNWSCWEMVSKPMLRWLGGSIVDTGSQCLFQEKASGPPVWWSFGMVARPFSSSFWIISYALNGFVPPNHL